MNKKNNALRLAVSATLATAALLGGANAQACNDQPYIGMVCMTAATYCPLNYAEANGAVLAIAQNQALYAVIGYQYGGDGRTTFALPDLRGRSAIGWGTGNGLAPVKQAEQRGAENVTLGVNNLPSHNHSAHAVNATGTSVAANNSWPANPATSDRTPVVYNGYSASGSEVTLNSGVVGVTGENTPVTNLPPQLGMRYCVATQGLFPPHN
jgi:microcystin-dependent protein